MLWEQCVSESSVSPHQEKGGKTHSERSRMCSCCAGKRGRRETSSTMPCGLNRAFSSAAATPKSRAALASPFMAYGKVSIRGLPSGGATGEVRATPYVFCSFGEIKIERAPDKSSSRGGPVERCLGCPWSIAARRAVKRRWPRGLLGSGVAAAGSGAADLRRPIALRSGTRTCGRTRPRRCGDRPLSRDWSEHAVEGDKSEANETRLEEVRLGGTGAIGWVCTRGTMGGRSRRVNACSPYEASLARASPPLASLAREEPIGLLTLGGRLEREPAGDPDA